MAVSFVLIGVCASSENGDSHLQAGLAALASGDSVNAVRELMAALTADPNNPDIQRPLGQALLETGDLQAAREHFRLAAKYRPNDFDAQLRLAQTDIRHRNYQNALRAAEAAHRLRPQNREADLARAQALIGSGQPNDALIILQRHSSSDDYETQQALSDALRGEGRIEEANEAQELADRFRELYQAAHDPGPATGALAPDFALDPTGGGAPLNLLSFRGKPLLLAFGSYSCPFFREQAPVLIRWSTEVKTLLVYIREAHGDDGWESTRNVRDQVAVPASRNEAAQLCSRQLRLPFPTLLDEPDNRVERTYHAWPSRLYLLDAAGRIVYQTRLSDMDFRTEDFERFVQQAKR